MRAAEVSRRRPPVLRPRSPSCPSGGAEKTGAECSVAAVSVVNPQGTEETGSDRPAAAFTGRAVLAIVDRLINRDATAPGIQPVQQQPPA